MALLANFQKLLSGGDKRSIAQADIVVQHVLDDLSRFDELFELLGLSDEPRRFHEHIMRKIVYNLSLFRELYFVSSCHVIEAI